MKAFDTGDVTALVRTDFDDDRDWASTRDATVSPPGAEFDVNIAVIHDRAYDGAEFDALTAAPTGYEARVLLVYDRMTRDQGDSPLLLIDWLADYHEGDDSFTPRSLRVLPSEADLVAVNLTLANMDLDDFARSAEDGIFRGFRSR